MESPRGRATSLSVGQRRRLALVAVEHDLLVLVEPANHLSLALVGRNPPQDAVPG